MSHDVSVSVCVYPSHAGILHRGRHAKMFGWAKSAAYDRRYTSYLWPITHHSGIGDKQKSCVMCVSKDCQKIAVTIRLYVTVNLMVTNTTYVYFNSCMLFYNLYQLRLTTAITEKK